MKRSTFGAILAFLGCFLAHASDVDLDESVLFFPTNAAFDEARQVWRVPVHGWIFESEEDSLVRQAAIDLLAKTLGLESGVADFGHFRERAAMFLVDNERRQRVVVQSGSVAARMERSAPNGHFSGRLELAREHPRVHARTHWVEFHAVLPRGDERRFEGRAQLLAAEGLSVVSDIDDTIKLSNVLNKRALMENTFLKAFSPVPGMAAAYRAWADKGAAFHYLSSSPWQLYPALKAFLEEHDYPRGSLSLRLFRLKDGSFWEFFTASEDYKLASLDGLMKRFPKRRFILVGDSGERDPEIYANIARHYPDRVRHVYIRDIGRVSDEGPRMREAFQGVSQERWSLFRDPKDLRFQITVSRD